MPTPQTIKMVFDSHILQIYSGIDNAIKWTSSGETQSGFFPGSTDIYHVTLEPGYVLDTVIADKTTIESITDTTFTMSLEFTSTVTVTLTSKQSASSPTFKHFFNAGTIGSGTIKFRHFSQTEPLPQLATPQNVTVDGTTLSWDAVENATSYDIYADGTLIGNTDGGGSGGTVTFNIQESGIRKREYFRIYDGTDTSGTVLYEITNSTAIPSPLTVNCSTGHLYVNLSTSSVPLVRITNTTGGVTATLGPDDTYIEITVTSNGTIGLSIDYDD